MPSLSTFASSSGSRAIYTSDGPGSAAETTQSRLAYRKAWVPRQSFPAIWVSVELYVPDRLPSARYPMRVDAGEPIVMVTVPGVASAGTAEALPVPDAVVMSGWPAGGAGASAIVSGVVVEPE